MRAFLLLVLLVSGPFAVAGDVSSRQVSFGLKVAQKGLWQEARFRFERALALNPENASALNDLAIALEQMGEFEKARECYEKALALKPGDTYIQQNFDLFREADDKRNRKSRSKKPPVATPDRPSGVKPPSEGPGQTPGDKPPSEGSDRPAGGR
jgi:tetratricopeptide (TPR) repeat protein